MRQLHYFPAHRKVYTKKSTFFTFDSHVQGHHTLLISRRFIGPRQYMPQGIRESTSRVPMTFEMG